LLFLSCKSCLSRQKTIFAKRTHFGIFQDSTSLKSTIIRPALSLLIMF
jgi:hypothetical protein